MNVKRKGNTGERELAELLISAGMTAHRNNQMYIGGKNNPDAYAEIDGKPLHIEVKRVESSAFFRFFPLFSVNSSVNKHDEICKFR